MPRPSTPVPPAAEARRLGRRGFLALSGVSVAGFVVAGCGGDDESPGASTGKSTLTAPPGDDIVLDFANQTLGVLNYAYLLEQLEAEFYRQVTVNLYTGISDAEKRILEDIAAHEKAHREFFQAVLGRNAINTVPCEFGTVDLESRDSVLRAALTFENVGVSAYNGAAKLIEVDGDLGTVPLEAAGDVVSVEARHAAVIGSLIDGRRHGRRFARESFDPTMDPAAVLQAVDPFISLPVRIENLRSQ